MNLKIAEQKREAYALFLKNFTEVAVAVMNGTEVTGEEADRNRMLSRDQLLLYGSDEVIRAYDTWIRCADDAEHDLDHEGKLVSRLFLAIRKDLLGKTNLTESDIENLNPFNRG